MEEKKATIKNFIGVYDNYISKAECENAIHFYNQSQKLGQTLNRKEFENASLFQKKDNQYFATANNVDVWKETLKPLIFNFDVALKNYEENTGIKEFYSSLNYTALKIQKTSPTEGYHLWHIEHGEKIENSKRVLVFTIYLNDVEEGGETEFLHFSKRVSPKTGRIVIWPAGFPYVHRGNPPLSGEKYIVTSWIMSS